MWKIAWWHCKASTTMREKSVHKMELNYIVKCIRKRLLLIKKKRHSKYSILNSPVMMTAYERFLNKHRKNIRKCFPFLVVAGDITQGLVHACQVFQLPLRYTLEPEMETICIHWWEESRRYAQNKLDVLIILRRGGSNWQLLPHIAFPIGYTWRYRQPVLESLNHHTDKLNVYGTWWFPSYPLCAQSCLWVGQQEPRTQQHMLGCGLWTQRGNTSHRHLGKKTHCDRTFMAVHIWFLKIFWANHHLSIFTCTIRGSISAIVCFPHISNISLFIIITLTIIII